MYIRLIAVGQLCYLTYGMLMVNCLLLQRRLLNFVDKTLVEDVIPILQVASHSELTQVLEKCVQRIARSDFDDIALDKELAPEAVILWFAAAETMSSKSGLGENSGGYDNRLVLMKVFKAMASLARF